MKVLNTISIIVFFVTSFSVYASELVLCTVTSDIDNDTAKIVYEMDQDNRAIQHLYQDSFHEGTRTARIELDASGLKDGVVLNQKDKYIIVRMHSDNYDSERGGVLYLDTLYSGVSGQRKEYEMDVVKTIKGFELVHNNSFTQMKFIAKRSKVLGVIGIERVEFGN